jgi:hypothetical protein
MSLTEINADDLKILECMRMERLLCFFATSLPFCLIKINIGNILAISCPYPEIMFELINELEDLHHYASLILGVNSISLHLAQEEMEGGWQGC